MLYIIRGIQTPHEAWQLLRATYQQQDPASRLALIRRLNVLVHDERDDISTVIRAAKELIHELRVEGGPLDDADAALRLIGCVQTAPSWDIACSQILLSLSAENRLTFAAVEERLRMEQQRRDDRKIGMQGRRPPGTNAAISGGAGGAAGTVEDRMMAAIEAQSKRMEEALAVFKRQFGMGTNKNIKCYNCGTPGHISARCKKPCGRCGNPDHKNRDCPQPPTEREKAAVATADSANSRKTD